MKAVCLLPLCRHLLGFHVLNLFLDPPLAPAVQSSEPGPSNLELQKCLSNKTHPSQSPKNIKKRGKEPRDYPSLENDAPTCRLRRSVKELRKESGASSQMLNTFSASISPRESTMTSHDQHERLKVEE